ncbi:hypothetical protein H0266_11010 [Halobacillus locisalis]|uniref:Uncharacterized protein n=1 Tax=Halobacillus locisalis TaxID=220753 RepID=A0A838CU02_9BACI|nr:hypothetical protein [Halobacillus locisalis]MBA2175424.1 hypothetical protein [Halobacillus locisalis]
MNKREGMMVAFFVLAFIGFFVWYDSGSKHMNGQSDNWSGKYMGHIEDGKKVREFTLTYEGEGDLEGLPVTYKMHAPNEVNNQGTKLLSNSEVRVEVTCSVCRLPLKSEEIKIHIEWDGKEEEFVLTD